MTTRLKAKVRVTSSPVRVSTAWVGENSLAGASLQNLGDVDAPNLFMVGGLLQYNQSTGIYETSNVIDAGIF